MGIFDGLFGLNADPSALPDDDAQKRAMLGLLAQPQMTGLLGYNGQPPEGRSVATGAPTPDGSAIRTMMTDADYAQPATSPVAPKQLPSANGGGAPSPTPGVGYNSVGQMVVNTPADAKNAGGFDWSKALSGIYGAGGPGDGLVAFGTGLMSKRGIGAGLAAGAENMQRQQLVTQQTDALRAKTALAQQQLTQKGAGQNATFDYLVSKGKDPDQARAAVLAAAGGNDKVLSDMLKDEKDKVGTFTGSDNKVYSYDKSNPSSGATAIPGQADSGYRLADGRPASAARPGDVIYGPDGKPSILSPNGTSVAIDQKGETAESAKIGEGKGAIVNDVMKMGASAPRKIEALNTIQDAMNAGGGKISTGPFAAKALEAKQAIKDAFGIDLGGIPETEVASKTGFGLAAEASRAISNRGGTQAEFLKGLQNVPGIFLSPEGNQAMISILKQQAQQEQQLGIHAYNHKPGENWLQKEHDFYESNPIMSPFTGQPMGKSDVDLLKSKAAPAGNGGGGNASNNGTRRTRSGLSYSVD